MSDLFEHLIDEPSKEEEFYYIIEESRHGDVFVNTPADLEVENHQWDFVVSNGVEDEN